MSAMKNLSIDTEEMRLLMLCNEISNARDDYREEMFRLREINAEMLKALKEAVEPLQLYQAYGWPDRGGVIRQMKTAIKNAEGKQ
jgi:hypothetical protein